jgi:tetratricopeptide (TPR) repeat protein
MTIKYPINNFLHEIFPTEERTIDSVKKAIVKHHAQGVVSPTIEEKEGQLIVTLDTATAEIENKKFRKLIALCDQRKFTDAEQLAKQLIAENPKISEYHRILGQIQSENGDQEAAIDTLIDALRNDPYNEWALLMMGNIQAKYKKDIDTALHYFNQSLSCNSNDPITMTSIGFLLQEKGRLEEAVNFCHIAIEINPKFPNTHLTLAFIAEKRKNPKDQFSHAVNALKCSTQKDQVYQGALKMAHDAAEEMITWPEHARIINKYRDKLQALTDKPIKMAINDDIPVSAKISIAEYRNQDQHLLEYKSNSKAVEHLVMHE